MLKIQSKLSILSAQTSSTSSFLPSSLPPFLPSFLPHHHYHPHHRPSSKSPRLAWSLSPSSSVSPFLFLPSFHLSLLRPSFLLPSSINHISTTVMLVSLASSLSLSASCRSERTESIPGIFKGIESKMFFKNQRNSWNFSSQKWKKFREFSEERSQRNVWKSVLAKIPGIFGLFATARFYNSKRHWRCAGCSVFMKGKIYLWKESNPYER